MHFEGSKRIMMIARESSSHGSGTSSRRGLRKSQNALALERQLLQDRINGVPTRSEVLSHERELVRSQQSVRKRLAYHRADSVVSGTKSKLQSAARDRLAGTTDFFGFQNLLSEIESAENIFAAPDVESRHSRAGTQRSTNTARDDMTLTTTPAAHSSTEVQDQQMMSDHNAVDEAVVAFGALEGEVITSRTEREFFTGYPIDENSPCNLESDELSEALKRGVPMFHLIDILCGLNPGSCRNLTELAENPTEEETLEIQRLCGWREIPVKKHPGNRYLELPKQ